MLSLQSRELLQFLSKAPDLEEERAQRRWICEINQYRAITSVNKLASHPNLQAFQKIRTSQSRSLSGCPKANINFLLAHKVISLWMRKDHILDASALIKLNNTLTGQCHKTFRTIPIFTALVRHIDPQDLKQIMDQFFSRLASEKSSKEPLYQAFLYRYWLLSIHPFCEANGRTSQLVADYILLKNGYLPQAFLSPLDIALIGHPTARSYMTPHEAFRRFLATIKNAYRFFDGSYSSSVSKR